MYQHYEQILQFYCDFVILDKIQQCVIHEKKVNAIMLHFSTQPTHASHTKPAGSLHKMKTACNSLQRMCHCWSLN